MTCLFSMVTAHKISKRIRTSKTKKMLIVLVVLVIGVGGWYYWGKSTPTKNAPVDSPSGLDYRQQKVAEGAYILKDRDSIKQTLTKQEKVDTNLKENKEAIQLAQKGKESYKLHSVLINF